MIKTLINTSELDKLIQLASALKRKGKWKESFTEHDDEIAKEILNEYGVFWSDIIRKCLPYYNPEQHKVNVQGIYISPEMRDAISKFLPPGLFFRYSPSVVEKNVCIIDESTILIEKRDDVQCK